MTSQQHSRPIRARGFFRWGVVAALTWGGGVILAADDKPDGRPASLASVSARQSPTRIVSLQDAPSVDQAALDETIRQLGPGFRVSETRRFVVVSNCDPLWTRSRESLLERTYHEVMRFGTRLGVGVENPPTKLLCVMIDDHDQYQAFARANDDVAHAWVAGYYAGATNRVVLYNDESNPVLRQHRETLEGLSAQADELREKARVSRRDGGEDYAQWAEAEADRIDEHVRTQARQLSAHTDARATSKAVHEAAHLVAFNCGLQLRTRRYPLWITEGLATCFETDDPTGTFGPHRANGSREEAFAQALAGGAMIDLPEFLSVTELDTDAETAGVFYAQSYALFRYMARYHREQLGDLIRDIALSPRSESPVHHLELFQRHFGPARGFQRSWLKHER